MLSNKQDDLSRIEIILESFSRIAPLVDSAKLDIDSFKNGLISYNDMVYKIKKTNKVIISTLGIINGRLKFKKHEQTDYFNVRQPGRVDS